MSKVYLNYSWIESLVNLIKKRDKWFCIRNKYLVLKAETIPTKQGVRQSWVLSPLLFNFYPEDNTYDVPKT